MESKNSGTIQNYSTSLDIRNIESLPHGTGAPFLLCLKSHEAGVLIAHSWKRQQPDKISADYVLVAFRKV